MVPLRSLLKPRQAVLLGGPEAEAELVVMAPAEAMMRVKKATMRRKPRKKERKRKKRKKAMMKRKRKKKRILLKVPRLNEKRTSRRFWMSLELSMVAGEEERMTYFRKKRMSTC